MCEGLIDFDRLSRKITQLSQLRFPQACLCGTPESGNVQNVFIETVSDSARNDCSPVNALTLGISVVSNEHNSYQLDP